jgi:S-adenosylmethionine synthetase
MTLEATQTKPEARRAPATRHALPFTSESVTEGHPDKVADQISDAILDAILKEDPMGRVACETLVTTGLALVSGEVTTKTYVDIPKVVRETIRSIGYDNPVYGFDSGHAERVCIDEQSGHRAASTERAQAVWGLMFGYAVRGTPDWCASDPARPPLGKALAGAGDQANSGSARWEVAGDGHYEGVEADQHRVLSTQHVEMTDAEIATLHPDHPGRRPVLPRELIDGEPSSTSIHDGSSSAVP